MVVPIIHNGYIEGMIIVNSEIGDAFHSTDVALIEAVAAEFNALGNGPVITNI